MDRDSITDPNALILYRLQQQDERAIEVERRAESYRSQIKQDLSDYRVEIKATLTRVFDAVTQTNGRIQSLERWKAWIHGALAAFGVILAALGAVVGWLVTLKAGH
jgi:hypothetical protein